MSLNWFYDNLLSLYEEGVKQTIIITPVPPAWGCRKSSNRAKTTTALWDGSYVDPQLYIVEDIYANRVITTHHENS